jgi:alkylation response protein AidB-like acyl-CoA dehydrogenase
MSVSLPGFDPAELAGGRLESALVALAANAPALDASPRFPAESFSALAAVGVPQLAADRARCNLAIEVSLIRSVAAADASTARILDGHFNGVERLCLTVDRDLLADELDLIAAESMLLGVWGADPAPGEGTPAELSRGSSGMVLNGVKTFCSGAGGVERALIVARDEHGSKRLAYVDVSDAIEIDRGWYRASGLRASESHRVEFRDTRVLALIGAENEIVREPWIARDGVRTAATWAGIADSVLEATLETVGDRRLDDLQLHTLGGMRVAQSSIDRWLGHAVEELGDVDALLASTAERSPASGNPRALAAECRVALAAAARVIASDAARVCGSRALIGGSRLDRSRRDLDLFLLQHRLDPKLVELGARMQERS